MSTTYIKLPVIVLYVEDTNRMPKYYHRKLETAVTEASRLSKLTGRKVYFIEYGTVPSVLGYMDVDGVIHGELK